jgi:hypothetical protein
MSGVQKCNACTITICLDLEVCALLPRTSNITRDEMQHVEVVRAVHRVNIFLLCMIVCVVFILHYWNSSNHQYLITSIHLITATKVNISRSNTAGLYVVDFVLFQNIFSESLGYFF